MVVDSTTAVYLWSSVFDTMILRETDAPQTHTSDKRTERIKMLLSSWAPETICVSTQRKKGSTQREALFHIYLHSCHNKKLKGEKRLQSYDAWGFLRVKMIWERPTLALLLILPLCSLRWSLSIRPPAKLHLERRPWHTHQLCVCPAEWLWYLGDLSHSLRCLQIQ